MRWSFSNRRFVIISLSSLYGLGRNEEAKQELEAALATDKPFKEAEEARKLLAQIGSSQ